MSQSQSVYDQDIVVIGAGPGGYAAAFYAADLGYSTLLIEQDDRLGGVCLNRGCIPSKSLLHATGVYNSMKTSKSMGIQASQVDINLDQLRDWKDTIVSNLATGVQTLADSRNVTTLSGKAHFESSTQLRVNTKTGQVFVNFKKAIIATGSSPLMPASFDLGSQRIMTSTEALNIKQIPKQLLVIGGGYIGMELGVVYARLGSSVHVVEASGHILAGADRDLIRPVEAVAKSLFSRIEKSTKVTNLKTEGSQILATLTDNQNQVTQLPVDAVLVAVGRVPNTDDLGLDNTQVQLDDSGFIKLTDNQQHTHDPAILAIGDCAGGLLLAHKASKEARVAIDSIAGHDPLNTALIPAVVFTDPEVAWVGLTESEAKASGQTVKVARFPWRASGRAMSIGRTDGLTKLIIDPDSERILGGGIVGPHAGDLISEVTLAIEMQATASDIAHVVHPHPTLSETILEASEAFLGHCTHLSQ